MPTTSTRQQAEMQAPDAVERSFRRLATAWREIAPSHPRNPVRYDHPVYQEIIGLGTAVLPYLLRALVEQPRDWFWALHVITGADPITPPARGDFNAMRQAWLNWGKEHGCPAGDGDGANGSAALPLQSGRSAQHAQPVEEKFQQLAAIWQAETCYLSSTTAIVNHPAYQEIIGMGPDAVPLILHELEKRPAFWFHALRTLTGANPVNPADAGKIQKIADTWVRWGRANGYKW